VWTYGGVRLDIHRHTAYRSARKVLGHGGVRACESGSRLKYAGRLYQDGRVLARRGRTGGAILIDGSGSMDWKQDTVERAVRLLPGVWVGWYSWHMAAYELSRLATGTTQDAYYKSLRAIAPYWGRLCIIAEKGRVAEYDARHPDEVRAHSLGNECDAECLEYIGKLPGPRVWVSDGAVYGDSTHGARCDAAMRKYGIVRVATVDDAVAYLEGKAVTGWSSVSWYGSKKVRR
jgi:hypothetical protein